jgi:tRNA dimethylallyltransferase
MKKYVVIILGPTAIGKTSLSISIANHYKTEIISADSRQIFKELSIGTAIPDSQQLNTVKHHMVQNHSIHEYYNASNFEIEALECCNSIFAKKEIIVMTGGSMLYIDTFCNGIDDLPTIDPEIRQNVINTFEQEGIESIRHELKKIDPEYYQLVDLKNYKRILHALEVYYMTGKKYSSFRRNTKKERDFDIIKIGLNMDRKSLHARINNRVDKMMNDGLLQEARNLIDFKHLNSLNTVGYKELFDFFDEKISLNEAIDLIKRNTRRYARKQLTWFNRDTDICWFSPDQIEEIIQYIDSRVFSNVINS